MKNQRRWIERATVLVGAVFTTLFFWTLAYTLAPDREAFLADRSWRYQLGWMPVHLLLGYFSIEHQSSAQGGFTAFKHVECLTCTHVVSAHG